jgi:hypothetical protein
MDKLSFPWMFIGPPGSGKTTAARKMLADSMGVPVEDVYPKDTRIFKVGDDYDCRVYCSPYHFEIDIPDMSMQDKQILVEILSMLFSAGDVFAGLKTNKRKLVILRRAHCLSLAAAVRLRWILETRICPQDGTGMIWICAREITGALSVIEDIFVRVRCQSRQKLGQMQSRNLRRQRFELATDLGGSRRLQVVHVDVAGAARLPYQNDRLSPTDGRLSTRLARQQVGQCHTAQREGSSPQHGTAVNSFAIARRSTYKIKHHSTPSQ